MRGRERNRNRRSEREGEETENIREKTVVGAEMPYTFRHKRCVFLLNLAISSKRQ